MVAPMGWISNGMDLQLMYVNKVGIHDEAWLMDAIFYYDGSACSFCIIDNILGYICWHKCQ
jgi:hypothetical protein